MWPRCHYKRSEEAKILKMSSKIGLQNRRIKFEWYDPTGYDILNIYDKYQILHILFF